MERDQALKFMHDLLRLMSQKNGSDLFITANFPPAIKVDGKIMPVSNQVLSATHTAELARAIMNDRQAAEFESSKECNFAISPSGIGRFRVNALIQQGRVAVVCRTINLTIPTLDELGLPSVLKDIAMTKRGLVIFVGGTGTGKTTSLAALVDHRNKNSHGHIITIEDPIEFLFTNHAGNPVTTQSFYNYAWRDARKVLLDAHGHGKRPRVHDLRHTVGMRLREAGVPEGTISDVLWHSTRSMTQHYSTAQIVELHGALEKITADSGAWNKSLATLRAEHQARQMAGRKVANG